MSGDIGHTDLRARVRCHVPENCADSIMLGPAVDGAPGDDWVLQLTSQHMPGKGGIDSNRVNIRLSPAAITELDSELKTVDPGVRQTASQLCEFCGTRVDLDRAVPDDDDDPIHRHCYVDKYDSAEWLE